MNILGALVEDVGADEGPDVAARARIRHRVPPKPPHAVVHTAGKWRRARLDR